MHASLTRRARCAETQPSIRHEPITGCSTAGAPAAPGRDRGEEGCDHPRQAHTGARLEEPQEVRHGTPHPGRGSVDWPKASWRQEYRGSSSRAIDENGAMTMPPPVVQGGSLHGAAEALEEEVKEAYRESARA